MFGFDLYGLPSGRVLRPALCVGVLLVGCGDGGSEAGPEAAATCERVAGGEGDAHDWAMVCASEASVGVEALSVLPGGDVVARVYAGGETWSLGGELVETPSGGAMLLRFDAQGEFVWHRPLSGDDSAIFRAQATCGDGVVLAGEGEGGDSGDAFVLRIDGEGGTLWSRTFEADPDGHITTWDLDCDAAGNVVMSGAVRGGADFGFGMQPAATSDGFVLRLDASGAPVFARTLLHDPGGSGDASGRSVAAADDGSTYLFLDHTAPVDLGTGPGADPQSFEQGLLARFSEAGEVQWQTPVEGGSFVYSESVAVDATGRAVVTGLFLDSVVLGGQEHRNAFPLEQQSPDADGTNYDTFVAAYDVDGTFSWGFPAGWMFDENAKLAAYEDGRALVYRSSREQIALEEYGQDGAAALLDVQMEGETHGRQYKAVAAGGPSVVLGATVDATAVWPFSLAPYARGATGALIVHFPR